MAHLGIFFLPYALGHSSMESSLGSFNVYIPALVSLMFFLPGPMMKGQGKKPNMSILNMLKTLNSRSASDWYQGKSWASPSAQGHHQPESAAAPAAIPSIRPAAPRCHQFYRQTHSWSDRPVSNQHE